MLPAVLELDVRLQVVAEEAESLVPELAAQVVVHLRLILRHSVIDSVFRRWLFVVHSMHPFLRSIEAVCNAPAWLR